ncbi:MAG: hypothetical protein ACFCD0_24265 [Gemmataceae bacterium]
MKLWDEYYERRYHIEMEADPDRLRMVNLHSQAWELIESHPDTAAKMLLNAQELANQLHEPWWAFFYGVWHVIVVIYHQLAFTDVLEHAIECTLTALKPEGLEHPWRIAAFRNLGRVYEMIDAVGYAEKIHETFNYLEDLIPPGPGGDRYVYLESKSSFAVALGQYEEALAAAQENLDLVQQTAGTFDYNVWYDLNAHMSFCSAYFQSKNWDGLRQYLPNSEALARKHPKRQSTLGEVLLLQAILLKREKKDAAAERLRRQGETIRTRLGKIPSGVYFNGTAYYHQLGNDWAEALQVRETELQTIQGRGMFGWEADSNLERCGVLAKLGQLSDEALDQARTAIRRLRKPEELLKKLEVIAKPE